MYLTTKSEWKQIVDRLEKYNTPISLRLEKNVMKKISDIFEHLTRLTNLVSCSSQSKIEEFEFLHYHKLTTMTNLQMLPCPLQTLENLLQR